MSDDWLSKQFSDAVQEVSASDDLADRAQAGGRRRVQRRKTAMVTGGGLALVVVAVGAISPQLLSPVGDLNVASGGVEHTEAIDQTEGSQDVERLAHDGIPLPAESANDAGGTHRDPAASAPSLDSKLAQQFVAADQEFMARTAANASLSSEVLSYAPTVADLRLTMLKTLRDAPDAVSANKQWSQCMKDAGFSVTSEHQLAVDYSSDDSQKPRGSVNAATYDALIRCGNHDNYRNARLAAVATTLADPETQTIARQWVTLLTP